MTLAFTSRWPIRETMAFERLFHRNLALTLSDKRAMLADALVTWMYNRSTGRLIGETYGERVTRALRYDFDDGGSDIAPFVGNRAIYVSSTGILPRYQGKGLAKILKAYFLGRCIERGYQYVIGHAKTGPSINLNRDFGATVVATHPDWYATGQLYFFYVLDLTMWGRQR